MHFAFSQNRWDTLKHHNYHFVFKTKGIFLHWLLLFMFFIVWQTFHFFWCFNWFLKGVLKVNGGGGGYQILFLFVKFCLFLSVFFSKISETKEQMSGWNILFDLVSKMQARKIFSPSSSRRGKRYTQNSLTQNSLLLFEIREIISNRNHCFRSLLSEKG